MSEPTHDTSTARHEPDVVNLRAILACAAALAAIAVVVHLGAWWVFRFLDAREVRAKPDQFPLAAEERQRREALPAGPAPSDWSAPHHLPPPPRGPRLEGVKRMEGQDVDVRPETLRAEGQLNRFEWVDRKEGVVRIPLDQAMDLIVEKGLLPARASAPEPGDWPSRANSGRTRERRLP